jgi:hypothetical protein
MVAMQKRNSLREFTYPILVLLVAPRAADGDA